MVRNAERQGVPETAVYPLRLGQLEIRVKTTDLSQAGRLDALGIEEPLSVLAPLERTRAIGRAATELEIESLLVPSVTGAGRNLVVFTEKLSSGPEVIESISLRSPDDWP